MKVIVLLALLLLGGCAPILVGAAAGLVVSHHERYWCDRHYGNPHCDRRYMRMGVHD